MLESSEYLGIISLMALRGGSDFLPYTGMSFNLHGENNTPYLNWSAKPLKEHVHHPPDEKQRHYAKDDWAIQSPVDLGLPKLNMGKRNTGRLRMSQLVAFGPRKVALLPR